MKLETIKETLKHFKAIVIIKEDDGRLFNDGALCFLTNEDILYYDKFYNIIDLGIGGNGGDSSHLIITLEEV